MKKKSFFSTQAFPHAMCAECAIFTRPMKMTKRSSGWRWKLAGRWMWSLWKLSWQERFVNGIWSRRGSGNGRRLFCWKSWHLRRIWKNCSTQTRILAILVKRQAAICGSLWPPYSSAAGLYRLFTEFLLCCKSCRSAFNREQSNERFMHDVR